MRNPIPEEIIPTAYEISKSVYKGNLTFKEGLKLLTETSTIKESVAANFMNDFKHLMNGEEFQRTLNIATTDYFLNQIYSEFGVKQLNTALISVTKHINYYENLKEKKVTLYGMRELVNKYMLLVYENSLISNHDQLQENIITLEEYLIYGNEIERNQATNLIRNGICFVAYNEEDELQFAPSRFLGYYKNNLKRHDSYKEKDGNITNKAISKILNIEPQENKDLEEKYFEYCLKLGFNANKAFRAKRKFWLITLNSEFTKFNDITVEFPEGRIVERMHRARERNSMVIKIAKDNFKTIHGKLFCEGCKFDGQKDYGSLDIDIIEGHHIIAVCDMQPDHKTKPEDIVMLCPNCHRVVHKKRPWLTINELQELIQKNGA